MEALDNAWYGSWRPLTNLTQTFRAYHLRTLNVAAIYIWRTTVRHDTQRCAFMQLLPRPEETMNIKSKCIFVNTLVYLPKEQNFLFINKPPFTSYITCPFTVTPETHLNDLMHSICQSLLWILNALHCSEQILSLKLVKLVCKACYHDKFWIQVQPLVCPSSTASKLTILRVLKVSVSIKLEILLASCQHRYLILCSWKLCQDLAGHNFLCGGWNL